ncbi:MAG: prepilin-type N-terminal cleavage/methylation domain-containing protein [Candidatus Saccharibacteria bacterium]
MKRSGASAFTIVELLVVIVVIGILAAITIVAYTGISQKAMVASLQSDLTNSSKQLKMFQTINGGYPITISTDCANEPTTTTRLCLKLSSGNTITSLNGDYSVNNDTTPQTFRLTITNTNSNTISLVTDSSKPMIPTPAPLNPVADWQAIPTGDHYGNFYDSVTKTYATVSRATTKTIYDPATQHIYDVPANQLAINPRSDGKNGHEALIEEGRTNYLLNSYGAANTNGSWDSWSSSISNVSGVLNKSITSGVYRSSAQRYQYTGVVGDSPQKFAYNDQTTVSGSFSATENASFSVLIKGVVSGCNLYIQIVARDAATASLGTQTVEVAPTSANFTRYSIVYLNLPVNTVKVTARVYVGNIGDTDTFDFSLDAAQLEKGAFATSYIPTTTAVTTRSPDVVNVPSTNWNASAGTILSSYYLSNWNDSLTHGLVTAGSTGVEEVGLDKNAANTARMIVWNAGAAAAPMVSVSGSGYKIQAGKWGGGEVASFIDGGSKATVANKMPASITGNVTIGNRYGYINSSISRLSVYSSALSDSDILSVTNAIKDGP